MRLRSLHVLRLPPTCRQPAGRTRTSRRWVRLSHAERHDAAGLVIAAITRGDLADARARLTGVLDAR